jgi:predicted Rdx family selenoprotein
MAEILNNPELERRIEEFTLVPSDGGRFEFSANGTLLYSKLKTGKHVEEGQLTKILKDHLAG